MTDALMRMSRPVLSMLILWASLAHGAPPDDLALQVALEELADVPKDVNTKATVCIGLGEAGVSDDQLKMLRAAAPTLSLKPYTIDCLVPVTEFVYVRVSTPETDGTIKVVAEWSRKSDESCFSDGIRRRLYEATSAEGGWHIKLARDEKPTRGTPMP